MSALPFYSLPTGSTRVFEAAAPDRCFHPIVDRTRSSPRYLGSQSANAPAPRTKTITKTTMSIVGGRNGRRLNDLTIPGSLVVDCGKL